MDALMGFLKLVEKSTCFDLGRFRGPFLLGECGEHRLYDGFPVEFLRPDDHGS